MSEYDRYYFEIRKDFKPVLIRRRKEFMELLLKSLSDDAESVTELFKKFGAKLVTKTNDGNDMSVLVDGERVYKI